MMWCLSNRHVYMAWYLDKDRENYLRLLFWLSDINDTT